jgi:hypothetical protein
VAGSRAFVRAIEEDDDAILQALLRLSRSRRIFAPLAFVVGALALLLEGVKVLMTNWRLMLVQVIPAIWIWSAMLDLKLHVLYGRSFRAGTPRKRQPGVGWREPAPDSSLPSALPS